MRDKRAASALAGLIKDPDEDVREQAVFALGQMRDVSAIDGLTPRCATRNPTCASRRRSRSARFATLAPCQPLISALKDEAADVREQAAFALGQIRDRARGRSAGHRAQGSAPDVREQVAFALGQIRDPRAIDALTAALKDASADVRQQAAFALGQLAR